MQGSFAEHITALRTVSSSFSTPFDVVAVRTPGDLALCRALIIPGGESTTISLLIRKSGLYEPLKEMVRIAKEGGGRALWGTCAGCILLAKEIDGPTSEGWEGLDGMDIRVARNQYGRQVRLVSSLLIFKREGSLTISRLLPRRSTASILLSRSPAPLPFLLPSTILLRSPSTSHLHPRTRPPLHLALFPFLPTRRTARPSSRRPRPVPTSSTQGYWRRCRARTGRRRRHGATGELARLQLASGAEQGRL
jgi:pyridoxal 5'-phosphate synthase glutaminase subunit Pdx2